MSIRSYHNIYIITLFTILFNLPLISANAQTYLYRRILIISNNIKRQVNDDAHYITFTSKGCYNSDKNGISMDDFFIRYVKDANNIHSYYRFNSGNSYNYYFSKDFSRLNILINQSDIFVYTKDNYNKTMAPFRKFINKSSQNDKTVVSPIIPREPLDIDNGNRSLYNKIVCPWCNGTGRCTSCNGTGIMISESIYTDGHKIVSDCPSCNGTGHCKLCHGLGYIRK